MAHKGQPRQGLLDALFQRHWYVDKNSKNENTISHNKYSVLCLGEYFLQLEDDVETVPNYVRTILRFASNQSALHPDWMMLEFCSLGAIGKLFRATQLPQLVLFTLQLHAFQPNDWIFPMFLYAQKCYLGYLTTHITSS